MTEEWLACSGQCGPVAFCVARNSYMYLINVRLAAAPTPVIGRNVAEALVSRF